MTMRSTISAQCSTRPMIQTPISSPPISISTHSMILSSSWMNWGMLYQHYTSIWRIIRGLKSMIPLPMIRQFIRCSHPVKRLESHWMISALPMAHWLCRKWVLGLYAECCWKQSQKPSLICCKSPGFPTAPLFGWAMHRT